MKIDILDVVEETLVAEAKNDERLSREFGMNLDTVEKARKWLTNKHNWHDSNLFVLKWDGLVPTISRHHGARLLEESWDMGLPAVVVREQLRLRKGGKKEEVDEAPIDQ